MHAADKNDFHVQRKMTPERQLEYLKDHPDFPIRLIADDADIWEDIQLADLIEGDYYRILAPLKDNPSQHTVIQSQYFTSEKTV